MSAKGYTSQRFAEIMNVQPSGISHILAGRNKPRFDFLVRLLERFPDVSPDWLLLGNGPMFRETELKGRDTLSSVMSSKPDNNPTLFKVDSLFAGSYAPGDSVDMSDNYHTFELYEDPKVVDLDYFDDETVIFDEENDFRHEPTPQGTAIPSPAGSAPTLSTTSHNHTQNTDFTSVEPIKEIVPEPAPATSSVPDSAPVSVPDDHTVPTAAPEPQTKESAPESDVTNVINTQAETPKVVKVILLYDNGKFESYSE